MTMLTAVEAFEHAFGRKPRTAAWAPGRVNLIGEHTDYNDGLVLPVAIHLGISATASDADDGQVQVLSREFPAGGVFRIDDRRREGAWHDAIKGVLVELARAGASLRGLRVFVSGDVPVEAGLSSSAAFLVSLVSAIFALAEIELTPRETARIARAVENDYFGVPCGILDQMASAACREGHALRLDCRSLETSDVPIPSDLRLLVGHTGVVRRLTDGRYAARIGECRAALAALAAQGEPVSSLREVTWEMLERRKRAIDPVLYNRALHVVAENARVDLFVKALGAGDFGALGVLLGASHESLRDHYEVSCPELDAMARAMTHSGGALGARLVGAGFGGCAIGIFHGEVSDERIDAIGEEYMRATDRQGRFYRVRPGPGARRWDPIA